MGLGLAVGARRPAGSIGSTPSSRTYPFCQRHRKREASVLRHPMRCESLREAPTLSRRFCDGCAGRLPGSALAEIIDIAGPPR